MVNKVIPTNMPHPVSMVGWDGTDFHILTIDPPGHLQIDVLSNALPTGAATAANQLTEITALQLIDDLRAALHSVNTDELQVNVEDSVLPTGAATAANQVTEITDLETMMLYDRGLSKVVNIVSLVLAAHGVTTRYTYTVPANHRALLESICIRTDTPSAGTYVLVYCYIDSTLVTALFVESTDTTYKSRMLNWSGEVWMTAGTELIIATLSTSVGDVYFRIDTILSEFDA
jgi:hypothetical protein